MSSTLTVLLVFQDFPDPPILEVRGEESGHVTTHTSVALYEPISSAGITAIVRTVVRSWIEPELGQGPAQSCADFLASVGRPQIGRRLE